MEKGVEMTPFVFYVNYFIERILIAVTVKKDFVIAKKSSPFRPFECSGESSSMHRLNTPSAAAENNSLPKIYQMILNGRSEEPQFSRRTSPQSEKNKKCFGFLKLQFIV